MIELLSLATLMSALVNVTLFRRQSRLWRGAALAFSAALGAADAILALSSPWLLGIWLALLAWGVLVILQALARRGP
jgi:hypothetical protein